VSVFRCQIPGPQLPDIRNL